MSVNLAKLHELVSAVFPIEGVYIIDENDKNTWGYHAMTEPTDEQKDLVKKIVADFPITSKEQDELNTKSRGFLAATDWKILRHNEQLAQGIAASLSDSQLHELLQQRQAARNAIKE